MEGNKLTEKRVEPWHQKMRQVEHKIFGIGLSRTGTRSLADAFQLLGYNFIHNPGRDGLFESQLDGACDISVTRYYKELDKTFPNSKFIHTIREKEQWLVSIEAHLKRKPSKNRTERIIGNRIAIYGQVEFNKNLFSKKYDQHYNDVDTYFKERPEDLLIINICEGDGWEKLIPFIYGTFPHKNKVKK